jgi:hypothetical protein
MSNERRTFEVLACFEEREMREREREQEILSAEI